jgi:hypothetical protein
MISRTRRTSSGRGRSGSGRRRRRSVARLRASPRTRSSSTVFRASLRRVIRRRSEVICGWLVGQMNLATHPIGTPSNPHLLHEFGIAGPADPTDRLACRLPLSGPWPRSILLRRADVAGLYGWWDDLHPGAGESVTRIAANANQRGASGRAVTPMLRPRRHPKAVSSRMGPPSSAFPSA